MAIALIAIVGVSLIIFTTANAPAAVGPYIPNQNNPSDPHNANDHWHAALGVYDCDHWLGDSSGAGIWVWPYVTPQGSPAQASNSNVYAGMHSHDDGIIHMEPQSDSEAGRNATVGLYFQYGGWKLSSTGYNFLGTKVENGDKCGTGTGTLHWEVAHYTPGAKKQPYKVMTGNPGHYKLYDSDIVVLAFLPAGKTLASIGDPPSMAHLPNAANVETPAGQTATTMPPVTPTPSVTGAPSTVAPGTTSPATTPTTSSPTTATPTTKKP